MGPLFRCRRVGLGISAAELVIPVRVQGRMPWIEDGTEDPECGWAELQSALYKALDRIVNDHLWGGGSSETLRFAGWTVNEIRESASAVMASAEET